MTKSNPIADLLGITPVIGKTKITINDRAYELYISSDPLICEGMYRANPGHGVSNPCFSLHWVPATHHKMVLGQYLAGRRGVKRAEAEAIVDAARAALVEG